MRRALLAISIIGVLVFPAPASAAGSLTVTLGASQAEFNSAPPLTITIERSGGSGREVSDLRISIQDDNGFIGESIYGSIRWDDGKKTIAHIVLGCPAPPSLCVFRDGPHAMTLTARVASATDNSTVSNVLTLSRS